RSDEVQPRVVHARRKHRRPGLHAPHGQLSRRQAHAGRARRRADAHQGPDVPAGDEMMRTRRLACLATMILAALTAVPRGQSGAPRGEWPTYGGDLGHTRYAPLDQITAANFNNLEIAWRFKTDNL